MIKATCTWGEGPDIILHVRDHIVILFEDPDKTHYRNGTVKSASTDLSLEQAKELLHSLQQSIQHVEELEQSLLTYYEE